MVLPVGIVSLVGALCVWDTYRKLSVCVRHSPRSQRRLVASCIRTTGCLLWPLALFSLVPRDDHDELGLLLPLAWNATVWTVDTYLLHHAPAASEQQPASLRLEHSSLTGLGFGMCSLLGARHDSKYTHLFMYAILGCLLLVLPSHNLEPGCLEEQVFENLQKTALVWCIGLLITGVVLTRRKGATGPSSVSVH